MIDGKPCIDRRRPSPLNDGFAWSTQHGCMWLNPTQAQVGLGISSSEAAALQGYACSSLDLARSANSQEELCWSKPHAA